MRTLDPQQRELARLSILRHLDASSGATAGLGETLLQVMLRNEGSPLTIEQLKAELEYLQDKQFIAPLTKAISPELKLWRITAAGRDAYAQT